MRGQSPASSGHQGDRLGYLLRGLAQRVAALERPRSVVVGQWVLDTDADGNLTARHAGQGTVTVIATTGEHDGR